MNDVDRQPLQAKEAESFNLRFIKPSKYFYNSLMALWLRFDHRRVSSLTFEEFVAYLKKHSILFKDRFFASSQELSP